MFFTECMKPIRQHNLPKVRSKCYFFEQMICKHFFCSLALSPTLHPTVQFVYEVNVSPVLRCIISDFSVFGLKKTERKRERKRGGENLHGLILSSSQLGVWQPLVTPWPLAWNVIWGQSSRPRLAAQLQTSPSSLHSAEKKKKKKRNIFLLVFLSIETRLLNILPPNNLSPFSSRQKGFIREPEGSGC